MTQEVTVAMTAAIAALVVALVSAGFTALNTERTSTLHRQAKLQERADTAKAELDRYREPLLRATLDLAHRLNNIRNDAFLDEYLDKDTHRGDVTRTSTLYRFARYWCVVENLYDNVALLRFEQDQTTGPVAGMLRDVGRAFASDSYGQPFMMWREEQRAIAELMRVEDTPSQCIGFATFVDRYDDIFESWFASFEQDLRPSTARTSQRFAVVQVRLALLAQQLDASGTYRDQWASLLPAPAPHSNRPSD